MSDEALPMLVESLVQRVAELERRMDELAVAPGRSTSAEPPAPDLAQVTDHGETERRRAELEALERQIQSAQTRFDQARTETGAAEERRAALETRAAAVRAEADQLTLTRKVIERIWPTFMLTTPFAEWKTGIETSLLQETPSSSAALLFANLHGYTACLLENDLKYLRDVLRDISRFLYAWVKENGRDERSAFDVALAWAAAFNQECAGRCEIEVPEPGTPANSLSMTFPPRGSSPEVSSVRTWCVRDGQKRVIHRAEVFT